MSAEDFHKHTQDRTSLELEGQWGMDMTKTHCTWMKNLKKINKDRGESKDDNFQGNGRSKFHKI